MSGLEHKDPEAVSKDGCESQNDLPKTTAPMSYSLVALLTVVAPGRLKREFASANLTKRPGETDGDQTQTYLGGT